MKSNAYPRSISKASLVVNCGLLIAVSIVLKLIFEVYIPLGGFPSLRVNLTSLPIMLSGIVFGPFAGLAVGLISDLLCFFIKPGGPFFIGFTIASGLIGFIPGVLWQWLVKKEIKHLEWFNLCFIATTLVLLFASGVFKFQNHQIFYGPAPLSLFVLAIFAVIIIGYVAYPIVVLRSTQEKTDLTGNYLLFVVSVTQLTTSILLNTWFLTILYGQVLAVLLPARLITNIFLIPFYTLVLAGLLKIISKSFKNFI